MHSVKTIVLLIEKMLLPIYNKNVLKRAFSKDFKSTM